MIEINLLPHREAKRVADLRESVAVLALGLILIGGGVYFADKSVNEQLAKAESQVRQLESDIARFRPEEEKVKAFRVRREQLEDKLAVIDGLDQARTGPLRMMDELTRAVPERLWISSLNTQANTIKMQGASIDTGIVADFLRALNASDQFVNVDLDRTSGAGDRDGVRIVSFMISASMAPPKTRESS